MLSEVPEVSTVVLALVGERGREVREFLEDVLGPRRQRVVAVVATGDDNPAVRRLAPKAAMTVAEYFRGNGEQVLLLIDSVTRFAHAQRECALASASLRSLAVTLQVFSPKLQGFSSGRPRSWP